MSKHRPDALEEQRVPRLHRDRLSDQRPGFGILGSSGAREAFKGCMESQQYQVSE